MAVPNIIEIKDIKKTYHSGTVETPVLHGIDLNVRQGEFMAIMGPSGSGKSTLMHILGFLDQPSEGVYKFEDVDVSSLEEEDLALLRRERIGFVFQAFFLLPRATVIENVMLPLLYKKHEHGHDMARKALESVGLQHRMDYLPTNLSGGEKQRTAIARALVSSPSIIFADEPTGNLDSKSGKQVMNIFQKLNMMGHTVILVTHEKYTAQHAERIIHIRDGLIEREEKVKDRIKYGDGEVLEK